MTDTSTINVYRFTADHGDTQPDALKLLLGGKGANLNRMAVKMGFPVPEGFTITTGASSLHQVAIKLNPVLAKLVTENMATLQETTNLGFGETDNPLLVSVRSGAPVSMPGMMETVLNLGLNDATVEGLAKRTNPSFAWDSYRRFITMYGTTVLGVAPELFAERYEAAKAFSGGCEMGPEVQKRLVEHFKTMVKSECGHEVPQDVDKQLEGAILAVFRSWNADKAKGYREIEGIPDHYGTAVNVQRMVFGNMNNQSGTGVAFTRNPNTGENKPFGDFLVNAQGEDVVDGSSITLPLNDMNTTFPKQYKQLLGYMSDLEGEFKDMCDIEFTIENNKLFMLQTRVGKRATKASIRIAIEMFKEGHLDAETAMGTISDFNFDEKAIDSIEGWRVIGSGVGASPGVVIGKAVFSWEEAVRLSGEGEDVILIRPLTDPGDVKGMAKAVGILTSQGGLVSHAAVVARGWNKPCIVGADTFAVNSSEASVRQHDGNYTTITAGQLVKINGENGEVSIETETS